MSRGIHLVNPTSENIKKAVKDGFNFMALGIDTLFINNYAREIIKNIKKYF